MTIAEGNKAYKRILGNNAMGANFNSSSVGVTDYMQGLISISWAGYDGTTGSARVQISQDDTNWTDIGETNSSHTISGAADYKQWWCLLIPPGYIRVCFIEGDGTAGTATVEMSLKRRQNG